MSNKFFKRDMEKYLNQSAHQNLRAKYKEKLKFIFEFGAPCFVQQIKNDSNKFKAWAKISTQFKSQQTKQNIIDKQPNSLCCIF